MHLKSWGGETRACRALACHNQSGRIKGAADLFMRACVCVGGRGGSSDSSICWQPKPSRSLAFSRKFETNTSACASSASNASRPEGSCRMDRDEKHQRFYEELSSYSRGKSSFSIETHRLYVQLTLRLRTTDFFPRLSTNISGATCSINALTQRHVPGYQSWAGGLRVDPGREMSPDSY